MEDYEKMFGDVLGCFARRDIRAALRTGYRRVANKGAKIVRDASRQRIKIRGDRSSWDKSIRVYVYSKGGGFTITTKFHGRKGFHRNRRGLEKPVVMWAAEGTEERYVRGKGVRSLLWRRRGFTGASGLLNRGRMPNYGFVDATTPRVYALVEQDLYKELNQAVNKRAAKLGIV